MPTLTQTELNELAALVPSDPNNFTNQDAINYYTYLSNKGFSYADLALEVVTDTGLYGSIGNQYAAQVAYAYNVDFTVGSSNWLTMQHNLMQEDLRLRIQNGGNDLNWQQYQDSHADAFTSVGLPIRAWTPYMMLLDSDDPTSLWADISNNDGLVDRIQDFVMIGAGGIPLVVDELTTSISAEDMDQAQWVADIVMTLYDLGTSFITTNFPGATQYAIDLINDFGDFIDNNFGGVPDVNTALIDQAGISEIGIGVQNIIQIFNQAINRKPDPLVFDLDGDGVELSALNQTSSTAFFDTNNDGFVEQTSWVDADDGMLALDENSNGIIDNISELFGNESQTGFQELAMHDSNGDGVIDANDTIFNDLRIWQDANQDGISQSDELHTLSDVGISSISLTATSSNLNVNGNEITDVGSYTTVSGQTHDVYNVLFNSSVVNTRYVGDYDLDIRTAFLPTLRGYGSVPDLHISMSLDSTLLDTVTTLTFKSLANILTDVVQFKADFTDFFLQWTGADQVDPTSRGPHIDARILVAMENLTGLNYLSVGQSDPGAGVANEIVDNFGLIVESYMFKSLLQGAFAELFDGGSVYSIQSDDVTSTGAIDTQVLSDLANEIVLLSTFEDKREAWRFIRDMIDETIGIENLSTADIVNLDNYISQTNGSLDWGYISSDANYINFNSINGTSAADTVSGTTGYDNILAGSGDDVVYAGDLDDIVYGELGNDSLYGEAGNDTLVGGSGDDIYYYDDQGRDIIVDAKNDNGSVDKIVFTNISDINDVFLARSGNDLVVHTINGGELIVRNHFDGAPVEVFEVNTGQSFDTSNLTFPLLGTDGDDVLIGGATTGSIHTNNVQTIEGLGGNDTLRGNSYIDHLYGGDGNDDLRGEEGDDYLAGGAGDDVLIGGHGSDTYYYTEGYDEINTWTGDDKLIISSQYQPSQVTMSADRFGHLHILIDGEARVLVRNHFFGSRLNTIEFEHDGSSISLVNYDFALYGTEGNDVLNAINGNRGEEIYALGGDDTITTDDGDDYIEAGDGNDTVEADHGDDTVYGGAGDDFIHGRSGDDTLYGDEGNDDIRGAHGEDVLYGGDGADTLYGGDGADTIYGGDGNDIIDGDLFISGSGSALYWNGDDILHGGSGNDVIYGRNNNDTLYGDDGDDTLDGGSGNDILHGGLGNDTLIGGTGDNIYHYLAGNDMIEVNTGVDTLVLGSGILAEHVVVNAVPLSEDLEIVIDPSAPNGGGTIYVLQDSSLSELLNHFTLSDGTVMSLNPADYLPAGDDWVGTSGDDVYVGTDYDDTIEAGDGSDSITGGLGNDTIIGLDNINDSIYYNLGDGNDLIQRTDGGTNAVGRIYTDVTQASVSIYRSVDNLDNLIIGFNDGGYITLEDYYNDYTATEIYFTDGAAAFKFIQHQTRGSEGDDVIDGIVYTPGDLATSSTTANDVIYGYGGNDTINGGSGNDDLYGGEGDDILNGGSGNDTLVGGAGNDIMNGGSGMTTFFGGSGNDHMIGSNSSDTFYGGTGNDIFEGGDGSDNYYINTGEGHDIIRGEVLGDSDEIYVNTNYSNITFDRSILSPDDLVIHLDANTTVTIEDFLNQHTVVDMVLYLHTADINYVRLDQQILTTYGTSGDDTIDGIWGGASLNEIIDAGAGNDIVDGGSGNDTIIGGAGADTLTGGGGNDTFAYTDITDAGDTITDFDDNRDVIDLSELLDGSVTDYDQAILDGFLSIEQSGSDTLIRVDMDGAVGGSSNYVTVATVSNSLVADFDEENLLVA